MPPAVHPHARGDNAHRCRQELRRNGSPPRAWGQRYDESSMKRSPRFTPTRVGTTPTSLASKPDLPVHPHARGDNYVVEHRGSGHAGSPPRAWGQLVLDYRIAMIVRFTPTRVGTTQVLTGALPRSPVHPHARGDNTTHGDAREPFAGSPPRAWGQLSVRSQHLRRHRFTPTRVGTTNTLYRCTATNTVHPHARGDNLGFSRAPRDVDGSPPRAWGQRLLLVWVASK